MIRSTGDKNDEESAFAGHRPGTAIRHGQETRRHYFAILEELRDELRYADYLGALQRYHAEHPRDVRLLGMASFLIDYPFCGLSLS
jgi:hypothetical protein